MAVHLEILRLVESTPMVDTHEHLWEEHHRIEALKEGRKSKFAAPDFGILLSHYTDSDLASAGMPGESQAKLTGYDLSPKEKWTLVAPYYAKAKNTGYFRCLRESLRRLYGEDDLHEGNVEKVSDRIHAAIAPGFYEALLCDVAHIEYCQVNSLEGGPFMETAQPELLAQDLSTVNFCMAENMEDLSEAANKNVSSLKDWHEVIDWCFATWGPRAIATKNQMAYGRRLDFEDVPESEAAPLFKKILKDEDSLTKPDRKALQDHLFHYCLRKAREYKLPVKLHTGFYAGHDSMPLERLRQNAGDVCALLRAYPEVRFDLFHIGYPYQDEFIALAKQYSNAWIDMCWAWIINPVAAQRFLKEFIMAAPANKIFTFGGDFIPVEMVPGHAAVARQGIAQAVSELVDDGWLDSNDVPALVERLMRGNAHEVFDQKAKCAAWAAAGKKM